MDKTKLNKGDKIAVIDTSLGEIKIKLFPEYMPKTCENFIGLAEKGFYNGTIFHRVITNFMIQGGDPTGTGMGGESIYGEEFEDEIINGFSHIKGALSMANSGPNTNGSQFFIVQVDSERIVNGLDGLHTVFGQTYEGFEVIDSITTQRTNRDDRPLFDIVINSIKIITH